MKLTNAQRTELKTFEEEFANITKQYQAANQSRIDAAQEASRRARASKNPAQIQAARKQLQDVWVGLQRDREAVVYRIKPLLTPDQLQALEDEKNQWRSDDDEVNDPSSN
jgi:agmatine/peptidylarginine deiminase